MQTEVRGEEDMIDARMGAEAITARIGAVALPLAIILFVVSTHAHPSGDVMDNPTIFMEYARDDSWIAVHFVQWFAALLLISGLVALYYSITTKPEAAAGVVRYGLAAAVLTAGSFTMLQAVDGVALKWAVDAWASAPVDQEAATFAVAEGLRWTEYSPELLEHPAGDHPYPLWAGHRAGHRLPPLARVGSRGLWGRMDRPRTDGALYWLLRFDPQAGGHSSSELVGFHYGCLDVAQQ